MPRFMVHAEWRERVPGKWFLEARERTVEIERRHFGDAMKAAQRMFPGSRLTMRQLEETRK